MELCDPCFDWWESEVNAGRGRGEVTEFVPAMSRGRTEFQKECAKYAAFLRKQIDRGST